MGMREKEYKGRKKKRINYPFQSSLKCAAEEQRD
jgi:hypothetical protein